MTELLSTRRTVLRAAAIAAVLGTVFSVAAGIGFGNLTNEVGARQVLREIAARPAWYWPTVHLGFILGPSCGSLPSLASQLRLREERAERWGGWA